MFQLKAPSSIFENTTKSFLEQIKSYCQSGTCIISENPSLHAAHLRVSQSTDGPHFKWFPRTPVNASSESFVLASYMYRSWLVCM